MWIALDIIIVAIVLLYVIISAKRGFARTVVELVGFFLAVYLSFTLSGIVAEELYTGAIEPAVTKSIEENITETASEKTEVIVDDIWESLPKVVTNIAEGFGISKETIIDESGETDLIGFEELAENLTDKVLKPVIVPVVKTVVGILLFGLLMIVVKFLARAVNKIVNIPLIGGVNRFLGGILGVVKGLLVSYIVCVIISLILLFTENGFLIFTPENIEGSSIFKLLMGLSPINSLK